MFNDKVVEDKKVVKKVLSDFLMSEYFLRYEPRKLALFPVKIVSENCLIQGFSCFWRNLEFCSDLCAPLGATRDVLGILPVH